jgi:hypothetical protein
MSSQSAVEQMAEIYYRARTAGEPVVREGATKVGAINLDGNEIDP